MQCHSLANITAGLSGAYGHCATLVEPHGKPLRGIPAWPGHGLCLSNTKHIWLANYRNLWCHLGVRSEDL